MNRLLRNLNQIFRGRGGAKAHFFNLKNKVTCSNEGQVATHCPDVCGKCSEYRCFDSELVFFMGSGKERECSWLQQIGESERINQCKKPKVAQTCRDTCKFCE